MDVYFADLGGAQVLGPYTKAEIQPQLRARRQLGWPERNVWYIEAGSIEQARDKARHCVATARFYVHRTLGDREGWTGSIRGLAQTRREIEAWSRAGWSCTYVLSSASVRAQVRAWEKASKS